MNSTDPTTELAALHEVGHASRRRRLRPLRWHLSMLVTMAIVPVLLVAALMLWNQNRLQAQAVERGLLDTAQALSLAVDRELATVRTMAETLALSRPLRAGDFAEFREQSIEALRLRPGGWIILFEPSGQQLVNTLRPADAVLPNVFEVARPAAPDQLPFASPKTIEQAFTTGAPVYTDLFVSSTFNKPALAVEVPVRIAGRVAYVIGIGFSPEVFNSLLQQQHAGAAASWLAAVVDRNGFIIGRLHDAEKYIGKRATQDLLDAIAPKKESTGRGVTLEGLPVYRAIAPVASSGWSVVVSAEQREENAALMRSLALWGGSALALVVLGLGLATRFGNKMSAPIIQLAYDASHNRSLPAEPNSAHSVAEVQELEIALADSARAHSAELREREMRLVADTRRKEAEAANRAKDEFLAMLGHELRNPLGAIANAVRVVELSGSTEPRIAQMAQIMRRQSDHLSKIVDDLLDVARITSGKIVIRPQRVDLYALAAECVSTARATERGARHEIVMSGETAWVEGDPTRLVQVIRNLLDNALKYTPGDGRIEVEVRADAAMGQASLRIADDGMGIAPEMLPRIFDLFAQAEQSLDRAQGGLGLGLTVVKRLVEMQGGTVSVESAGTGRGASFLVRLPLAPSRAETGPTPAPTAAVRRRIVLIDDNADVRESLKLLLDMEGHEVHEASDGLAGLERIRALRPEVAIVDIGLPGLDGCAVARAVRESAELAGIKLVALTGFGLEQDRTRALAAGFDSHFVKPLDEQALRQMLGIITAP